MIKSYADLELTIFDRSQYPSLRHTYVEVAPTSRINPGLSFSSALDRSLVTIGEVFVKLDKTRLRSGDIVLAVNGVPVWKPEQADAEQLKAARNAKSLVLYCVDFDGLCDEIARYAKTTNKKYAPKSNRKAQIVKKARGLYYFTEKTCRAKARIDIHSSKLVDDQTDTLQQVRIARPALAGSYPQLEIINSYKFFCLPAILSVKEMLNKQLGLIQAKVVYQAWEYSVRQEDVPIFCVPSAPIYDAPVEITTTIEEGFDEEEVPLATAVALEGRNIPFDV